MWKKSVNLLRSLRIWDSLSDTSHMGQGFVYPDCLIPPASLHERSDEDTSTILVSRVLDEASYLVLLVSRSFRC